MALEAHVDALRGKHAELEARIAEEVSRPLPDEAMLHDLKKQKLRIKDEMHRHGH